jgi:hypothetical protein
MRTTYRDIYEEIRSSRGYSAADEYRREIERDGHSIYSYETAWGREAAIDGAHGTDSERYAGEAYDDLRRREERREEERRMEEEESAHAAARRRQEEEHVYYESIQEPEPEEPQPEEPQGPQEP